MNKENTSKLWKMIQEAGDLLHDIGDEFAPMNHSQYAAAVLRPYVSEKTHWIVENMGYFKLTIPQII